MDLTCTVHKLPKHSAHSFAHVDIQILTMMLRSGVVTYLHTKTSSHDNCTLEQVMSPRVCFSHENATGRASSPHAETQPWLKLTSDTCVVEVNHKVCMHCHSVNVVMVETFTTRRVTEHLPSSSIFRDAT